MNTRLRHLLMTASLAVVTTTAGCDLYFGHEYPPPCAGIRETDSAPLAPNAYRNPQNGQCQSFGGGYYPCEGDVAADVAAIPDWGSCYTACEGLSESACIAAPECFAAYIEPVGPADSLIDKKFYQCWDVAPSGPVNNREACDNLNADQCTRHNDCSPVYADSSYNDAFDRLELNFARCEPEGTAQGCYSDSDCQPGYGCTASTECNTPPGCDLNGVCPEVCYGSCRPLGTTCTANSCPDGTTCVVACPDDPTARFSEGACFIQCIPDNNSCAATTCEPGTHCEEICRECPPNADCSTQFLCETTCVPDQPQSCDQVACDIGSHCELSCSAGPWSGTGGGSPNDPMQPPPPPDMDCVATCVPDQNPTCETIDCGPGSHCEERCFPCDPMPGDTMCANTCDVQCVPDENPSCATVDCAPNTICVEQCDPNRGCFPVCVPVNPDPGSCTGDVYCFAMPPACPANTTPGIANGCWTGYCIPNAECGPNDPGTCGGDVICAMPPPSCPSGTVPGQRGGCWSGYCIPEAQCNAGIACEALTTEAACTNRTDCVPAYTGEQCTCYPDRCECQSTTFARCETAVMPFAAAR